MKKLLIILAVIGVLAGFGIYKLVNTVSKASDRGGEAVTYFHNEYNANRASALHAAAAPAFQKEISLETWNELHAMLHEKLGAWKSGDQTGVNVATDNGHETLKISFSSKFEKGEATEEFVFDYNGEKPLLLGYNVKSSALIEKASSVTTGTPSAKPSEKEAATDGEKAVAAFHKSYDVADVEAIHKASHPAFQKSVSIEKFGSFLEMVHGKLGKFEDSEQTASSLSTEGENTTLKISYKSKFEKGEGTENFVFGFFDAKPLLLEYNLKSPALIEQPAREGDATEPEQPEKEEDSK